MHQAALDVSLWPAVLQGWAELFHAEALALAVDKPGSLYALSLVVGLDESHLRSRNAYYTQIDPFMNEVYRRKLHLSPNYTTSHMLVPDADLEKSECYNDHMRPLNQYYGFGFNILQAPLASYFLLLRARRSGPVEGAEDQAVQSLIPHLRQAAHTTIQFATLTAERDSSFSEPLDALGRAVFLLDASGKVLRHNRSAAAIAAARDGLTVHADGLRASTPHHTNALRRLVALAAHSAQGGTLALPRPSQSRPYAITISPLHREPSAARFGFPVPAVAVVAIDPNHAPVPDTAALKSHFALTSAEARLAALLTQGLSLEQAASSLAITRNTARTHLQHLFQKTSTRKQGELVALLNRVLLSR
ncbi:MAG: helix-turn-helix transcriptional regulator [Bryobacterales bacterium]|nr:helix-turn-helix transcriptional regulator [Bryobacterales bacterium]